MNKKLKGIIFGFLIGALIFASLPVTAQFGGSGGFGTPSLWQLQSGGEVTPFNDRDVGSATNRVSNIYADNIDSTTATIGVLVSGDIDLVGNALLNVGYIDGDSAPLLVGSTTTTSYSLSDDDDLIVGGKTELQDTTYITKNGIGDTNTLGLRISNNTDATALQQQDSPFLSLMGQSWETGGGTSKESGWRIYSKSVSASTPRGDLFFTSYRGDTDATTINGFWNGVNGQLSIIRSAGLGVDTVSSYTASSLELKSTVADGATAVGVITNTSNAFSNSASRLLSVRNANTEKFAIGPNGGLYTKTTGAGGVMIQMTEAGGGQTWNFSRGSSTNTIRLETTTSVTRDFELINLGTGYLNFKHENTNIVRSTETLADDATIALTTGKVGAVEVFDSAGNYGKAFILADGTVNLISTVGNVADTDSDGDLSIYDGGDGAVLKNRTGASVTFTFEFKYQ